MDPTKCLAEILEELSEMGRENDWAYITQKLNDLSQWLTRGGFPPDVNTAVCRYLEGSSPEGTVKVRRKSCNRWTRRKTGQTKRP
jgi:hypothetical protein